MSATLDHPMQVAMPAIAAGNDRAVPGISQSGNPALDSDGRAVLSFNIVAMSSELVLMHLRAGGMKKPVPGTAQQQAIVLSDMGRQSTCDW
jgi:hypothetical protein